MQTKPSGSLFVVSGPSGVGKGTLVDHLRGALNNIWVSVSTTTRDPRPGDVEGVTYNFVSVDEFEQAIANDEFIEYANVYGNYYGTPIKYIKYHLDKGENVILEIDVQGGFQVKNIFKDAVLIFIAPPSLEVLEQRLRGRKSDNDETIRNRLTIAKKEIEASKKYDEIIINDNLNKATQDLIKVVQSRTAM